MQKVRLKYAIQDIQGTLFEVVFRRSPQGKTITTPKPDMSNEAWSEAHRERFSQASEYAKAALADPKVRAKYERRAKKQNKRPRELAVSDFFKGKDLVAGK